MHLDNVLFSALVLFSLTGCAHIVCERRVEDQLFSNGELYPNASGGFGLVGDFENGQHFDCLNVRSDRAWTGKASGVLITSRGVREEMGIYEFRECAVFFNELER
ncbi:MAG: hypothetical protein HYV32_04365 [Candidatus Kerfeldbacteria bacterium]|nr:hypothetical protein [Candidatus Kerfeldbacteria bacterium]